MCLGTKRRSRPWEPAPWRPAVEDELQGEVTRGHLGLGQHWAMAPLSTWDTWGGDKKKQPWGTVGRAGSSMGEGCLFSQQGGTGRDLQAGLPPRSPTPVYGCSPQKYDDMEMCQLRSYNEPSQLFPPPIHEKRDGKYWLPVVTQVEERKSDSGRWQWGEISFHLTISTSQMQDNQPVKRERYTFLGELIISHSFP